MFLALQAAYWSGDSVGYKKGKNTCLFFSVGFKCLSPLLAAPVKSQFFIIVQEQVSPFSPGKLVTGLDEDLGELDFIFMSNSSLLSLDESTSQLFVSISLSVKWA